MYKFKIIGCLLLLTNMAFGQAIREFSKDPLEFREQIGIFFSKADKDVVANLINGRLGAYLEKDSTEVDFLINGCNVLLEKRLRPEPHFRDFITAYLALESGASPQNYDTWKSVITGFGRTKSKRGLEEFLEFSALWFNNGVIFSSRTLTWSAFPAEGILEYTDEPSFRFTDVALTAENKGDATTIHEASGVYYPESGKWMGTKGMINWEKAELDPATNYATFGKHEIKFSFNKIDIDTAVLHTQYYAKPVIGKLQDKVEPTDDPNKIKHPFFESFDRNVVLPEILPNIDYRGGFALQGNRFAGMGDPENPARLIFKHNNKPFIEASSGVFFIKKDQIVSSQAAITVRLEKDSIYHPGLILRYDNDSSLLELIRDERGALAGPLYSSYHQIDFLPQRTIWHMGDSIMAFGTVAGNALNEMRIESSNFFTKERMDRLVYSTERNPMRWVQEMAGSTGGVFNADEFARYADWSKENARLLMADLSINGFVFYNLDTREVIVKQKLYDYVDNYDKRLDYDNIIFLSKMKNPEAPNAVLNLNTRDFEVFGVRMLTLSDSQSVAMYPKLKGNRIVMKENRKMLFGGVLKGGGFDFYGDSIQYDYVEHKVDLIKIDSVIIYINKYDSVSKKPIFFPVQTRIENITGELFIDMPSNKAGLDSEYNKEYPILKTNEESYAYYDKSGTFDKVYNREKFYFKIDPFFLDSLDDFNQDALSFPGVLVSDGIFPEIRDSLVVQEDYSLGFLHPTGQGGMPMYGGKATFTNDIKLSDKGLVGDGFLEYISSVSKSDKFYFFPDSTSGLSHTTENILQESAPDVPDFTTTFCKLDLYNTDDYLKLKSLENPFMMFNQEGVKRGELELSPAGLIGRGELDIKNGTLYSNLFKYNHSNAYADTAAFDLTTLDGSQVALATPQINAHIDFNYRIGTFKALDRESLISFPKNRFKAHMDVYKWYLDENKIELNSSTPPTEGSYASMMVASDAARDSLKFIAPLAVYDIETFEISCEAVQDIFIADAIVKPGDGKALILANGEVDTLRKATVIANVDNRYHTLFDANIVLKTGKSYIGSATYNYEDDKGNKQEVQFSNIRVDESVQTIADGTIPEEQGFQLNEFFDYRGKVQLKAREKGLFFNGSTRIMHKCSNIDRNWLGFSGQVDPKDVMIPVGTEIKNDLGESMAVGIMLSEGLDSTFLYPAFISQKLNVKDAPVTTALGFLWYNGEEKKYAIGSQERHDKTGINGNLLELNTQSCDITANGKLSFGTTFGQVKEQFVGDATYNYKTKNFNMEGTLVLDFMMDQKMLTESANKVLSYPFLKPLVYTNTQYEKAIVDLCSGKELASFQKTVKEKGMIETPDCLKKSLVLANVNFVWNRMTESFVSEGDVGLGNILDKNLFVDMRGKVEVAKGKRSSDIAVYFELDPQTWFFFKYRLDDKPRMQFQTTVTEVLDIYTTLKDKDRIMNTKKDEPEYTFELGPKSGKATFLDKF